MAFQKHDATPVPVWLLAPVGRDAALLKEGLERPSGDVRVLSGERALARALDQEGGHGVLLMTQEALDVDIMDTIEAHLMEQDPWEELPIVLLVDAAGHTVAELSRFQTALPRCKPLVLQRPVRPSELSSAVATMQASRRRQFALGDYIRKQEELRRELNHRVKNILSSVQAVYGLTARSTDDLATFCEVFEGRLGAMAGVHDVLFSNDYGISTLNEAIDPVLRPYREAADVTADGPRVTMGPEVAQSFALVTHELATNAAKYGALSQDGGAVAVSWRTEGEDFVLGWTETGGPRVTPPKRRGYGTNFIELTMRGYGGTAAFDYASGGLTATLTAPLKSVQG